MMKRLTKKEINLMIEIACYYREKKLSPNNYPFWTTRQKEVKNLIKKGYVTPYESNLVKHYVLITLNAWYLTEKGKLIVKLLLSTNTLEKLKEKLND